MSAIIPARSAASIGVENASRSYGTVTALSDVSLAVPEGSFTALLGPSGSGKTTLLMAIAGFERLDRGRILIGDRDMTRVPPHRRELGMVFQRYALFPHLSVSENVAYSLRRRGIGRAERERMVRDALGLVHLGQHGERLPSQLSGGQQQRVALARALVYRPPVLLMDEPLGALDRKLREQLQIEIRQLQQRLGMTVAFVTHDQQEALSMADTVAVLRDGRLVQSGPPESLHDAPASAFVADFIGEANVFHGTLEAASGQPVLRTASGLAMAGTIVGAASPGGAAELALRPSAVRLAPASAPGLQARVMTTVFAGESVTVLLTLPDGATMSARLPAGVPRPASGELASVSWDAARAWIYGARNV